MNEVLQSRTAVVVSLEEPRTIGGPKAVGLTRRLRKRTLPLGWWILPSVLGGLVGWALIIGALVRWVS